MRKTKYMEGQIEVAQREVETGTGVSEVIRKMGITGQPLYRRKKKYCWLGVGELRELKHLQSG